MSPRGPAGRSLASVSLAATFAAAALSCHGQGTPWGRFSGSDFVASGPRALAFEQGTRLPERRHMPAFDPVGPRVVWSLAEGWRPVSFPAQSGRCYAVQVIFDPSGVGDHTPLSDAMRATGARLVLRSAAGEVLATGTDGSDGLALCNWSSLPELVVDLDADAPLDRSRPAGEGTVTVQAYERALDDEEQWELGARNTPLLAGEGIVLPRQGEPFVSIAAPVERALDTFEPVPLGDVAPGGCLAATVRRGPDARIPAGVSSYDASFAFLLPDAWQQPAHEVDAGWLVARPLCNWGGEPLAVSLVLATRAGVSPGTGGVLVEAFSRPSDALTTRLPLLADEGLVPEADPSWLAVGAPLARQLEAFAPLELSVASGRCQMVAVRRTPGTVVAPAATAHDHYFVIRSRRGGLSLLAQRVDGSKLVARGVCNASLGEPWPFGFELVSHGAPGHGPVSLQLYEQAWHGDDD